MRSRSNSDWMQTRKAKQSKNRQLEMESKRETDTRHNYQRRREEKRQTTNNIESKPFATPHAAEKFVERRAVLSRFHLIPSVLIASLSLHASFLFLLNSILSHELAQRAVFVVLTQTQSGELEC